MVRVTGSDVPMPYAAALEQASLPQVANIVNSAKRILNVGAAQGQAKS